MMVNVADIPALSALRKPRFDALRRWWIEINLGGRDSDLTAAEWEELAEHYTAAGGTAEQFEALIERDVTE